MFKYSSKIFSDSVAKRISSCLLPSLKMSTSNGSQQSLNMDTINPNVKKVQYAVRGPIVIRATEIEAELARMINQLLEDDVSNESESTATEIVEYNDVMLEIEGKVDVACQTDESSFNNRESKNQETSTADLPKSSTTATKITQVNSKIDPPYTSTFLQQYPTPKKTTRKFNRPPIKRRPRKGVAKPFKEVIKANIGDSHAMGAKPITYIRQVVAGCSFPPLLEQNVFPTDVVDKCKEILSTIRNSVGCYSDSVGVAIVRKHIAAFIEERDGYPSNANNIIVTNGASSSVKVILELFASDKEKSGIMIPIPQYPLYSATVDELGMQQVGYYLDESNNWGLDISELKRALNEARKTCNVKTLCVINPGNPTGQVLSYENIKNVIQFAKDEGLFLLADEVYQDNIYGKGCAFHSFKKVLHDMGDIAKDFQMASFHSCSKGYMGECGLRGGYVEVIGLDDEVHYQLNKLQSAQLGSNVIGQLVMDCVVKPPDQGSPSYNLFIKEKNGVLASLKERAILVHDRLNKIDGITCNEVSGAMYAFPRLHLPTKAIEAAKAKNQEADFMYCSELLEETGICVIPGSGFRQQQGTYHFRMTILPTKEQLEVFLSKIETFHAEFLAKYND